MSKLLKAVLCGLLSLVTLVMMSTALSERAEAQTRTCSTKNLPSRVVTICVEFSRSTQPPYALEPYALAGYASGSDVDPTNFWAGLYQCNNSTGPECVLVSNSRSREQINDDPRRGPYKWQIVTSSKPYSFGHTYKACTTVTDVVNFCTKETT